MFIIVSRENEHSGYAKLSFPQIAKLCFCTKGTYRSCRPLLFSYAKRRSSIGHVLIELWPAKVLFIDVPILVMCMHVKCSGSGFHAKLFARSAFRMFFVCSIHNFIKCDVCIVMWHHICAT